MSKRKEVSGVAAGSHNGSADSDEDMDTVDVDFEWFFFNRDVDFHGIKQLLKQLFDVDNELINLSALTDLVIEQNTIGSTVKVTDETLQAEENDPFAFLSILNLHENRKRPEVSALTSYLASKAAKIPTLAEMLPSLLQDDSGKTQIGLVLSERFINMPPAIVPPTYKRMLDEVKLAVADNKPYNFTHMLILSKTYVEVASTLPSMDEDDRPVKRKKQKDGKGVAAAETFYFHPEDEEFARHALGSGNFEYDREAAEGASDAKRAFQEAGIKPTGHLILIDAGKFEGAVDAVERYIGSSSEMEGVQEG